MTREEMEARRMKAIRYFANGLKQADVWRALGVSRMAASRWHRDWKNGRDMKMRKPTGRPSRMTAVQVSRIVSVARKRDSLTCYSLGAVIQAETGIVYNAGHVWRLMHRWGLRERRVKIS